MPCDSRVTATQMHDARRVGEAMTALGYILDASNKNENIVAGARGLDRMHFYRTSATTPFVTRVTNVDQVDEVRRKYTELGLRAWAKASRFSVAGVTEDAATTRTQFTLVNRNV